MRRKESEVVQFFAPCFDVGRQASIQVSTRKTSGESDLVAALQCGSRIETAREPTTQSLLLSIPVMVPMSCLHFISCSFGGAKD
jgi:hypothetical protein